MANKRLFYACSQVQIAPESAAYHPVDHLAHGVQSLGITVNFSLEQIFELGQISIYENRENLPEIELTMEKVIDGYPLLYHLATPSATSASLVGRSRDKVKVLASFYDDTKDSASGVPISECDNSGMFISQITYTLPVEGNCTESVTLVGNNSVWRQGTFQASGGFPTNDDAPLYSGGVQRRENVVFGPFASGGSVLPPSIQGITSINATSGHNLLVSGEYGAHLQNITASVSLGRTNLNELGRKGPYHRNADFPVEVSCDIEVITTKGSLVNAIETQNNLVDQAILIKLTDGTNINLGRKNKLNSVTHTGGNAGTGGGNVTITYAYRNFNDFTITHPEDPAGL